MKKMKEGKRRILNVGCGNDTYGTDFVDLYPSRPEVKKCDVGSEKLPYPDETFDEVYSAFLLEHSKNPNNTLREMVRVLKKGGKIVIKTDNAGWWLFHKKFSPHFFGYKGRGKMDKHYCIFTLEHIQNHLKAVRLKNIRIKYFIPFRWYMPARIISELIALTPFKGAAYPHIMAIGKK